MITTCNHASPSLDTNCFARITLSDNCILIQLSITILLHAERNRNMISFFVSKTACIGFSKIKINTSQICPIICQKKIHISVTNHKFYYEVEIKRIVLFLFFFFLNTRPTSYSAVKE